MADYSVLCENQQIEIGKAGENLAKSCTIDYSAWVKEYGEGDLRIRAIRSGDAEPYPVTNVATENGVATWTFTDADTAVKGYGEVQILYYVEDVLVKSRVWRTYTHRSLSTSSEEVPDPYQDWLSEVERIESQIEDDAESASDSATRAAGSASEAAESALSATRSESSAQEYASAASSSADSAASSATAASRSATEASNYEYYSEQYMNEAKSAKFGAESARTGAENAKAAAQASATAAAQSAAQAEEAAESIEESADLIQKLMDNQIKDTATGTIASFPDGADMPMVSLVADIDPIQDTSGGSPSPTHICPISGWDSVDVSVAGKNLLNMVDVLPDGSYNGNVFTCSSLSNRPTVVLFDSPQTITFSYTKGEFTGSGARLEFLSGSSVLTSKGLASATPTSQTVQNVTSIRFNYGSGGTLAITEPQIELGSTVTDYEPFVSSDTYTTTLPQTVYGGTLDVVSGVLTVDRAMYEPTSIYSVGQGSGKYYWIVTNNLTPPAPENNAGDLKSNIFTASYEVSEGNCYITAYGRYIVVVPVDQTLNTKALADAWMQENHPQFCYLLKEPQTIQLTPTQIDSLLGRNNVWADSGDVTVEYIANTKLYIQKVMGAIG